MKSLVWKGHISAVYFLFIYMFIESSNIYYVHSICQEQTQVLDNF